MPVVVTGATGFIGGALVRALLASGAKVTTLHRGSHGRAAMEALGARARVVPLKAGAALAGALSGQQVLFNFAYDVRAGAEDNLKAFDALHDAAISAGIERFIHAGSAVVYDAWPKGPVTESGSCDNPVHDPYRIAKRSMDQTLMNGMLPAIILQPAIVYGPGSSLWIERPIAAMRQGGVVLPEPVGRCAAVFVGDVIQAALRAAILPDPGRERFLISGPDTPSWADYWHAICGLAGQGEVILEPLGQLTAEAGSTPILQTTTRPPLAARISAAGRKVLGHERFESLVARAQQLRGPSGPVRPDHAALELYASDPSVSIEKAQARLGYAPRYSFSAGINACRA
ncbi:hypothetical protein AYJ57_13230 [Salipiger sp. CCB-MM3]|nr:hypothetical protein AYJ57_13230 [Salipiger sp. CCB-MM3]